MMGRWSSSPFCVEFWRNSLMASAARALESKPLGRTPPGEPRQRQRFTWPVAYRMVWLRRNSQFSVVNTASPTGRDSPAIVWKEHGLDQAGEWPENGVVEGRNSEVGSQGPDAIEALWFSFF